MFFVVLFCLFVISKSAYNERLSHVAINLSQAAYCVSSNWTCATCDPTNNLEAVVETHGERGLVGYNKEFDTFFVAFRGSVDLLNWIDNIQFRMIYPYQENTIGVERGFYKAYQYIKPGIIEELNKIQSKYATNKLLITGHSLGAAITTIMVPDVVKTFDVTVYTFGSPRVGNDMFVEWFRDFSISMHRITHYYDIVPHLPQEMLGYLHIPQEVWYDEENLVYSVCNDDYNAEDNKCSDSCSPLHCTSTSDHLNYLGIPMGSSSDGLC